MTPLPLIDQLRARRELRIVKSIQRKLKKYKLILRETDKSGVFHIGHAIDYQRKAAKYRQDTSAYEELNVNPFNEIIYNVTYLLNQLKTMGKITEGQRMKMIPVRDKTQLAYMYFLPKPHKVITKTCHNDFIYISMKIFYLERNTTSTYYQYYTCSNNKNFQIFRSINSTFI
jgi:hypothetical protein